MCRWYLQKSDESPATRNATDDNIWNDRLLINAYETAIQLSSTDIAKNIAAGTNKSSMYQPCDMSAEDDDSDIPFKVGDFVRATYDVDDLDYEAKIISIDDECGDCIVRFIGYENEQTVRLVDLVGSWGEQEQQKQELEAAAVEANDANVDSDDNYPKEIYRNNDYQSSLPVPPIPPLPPMLRESFGDDSEHFSAMLMSWYMSGYYTGLYQGRKIAKEQQNKRSSKRK